jgi:hypothetical protein
MLGAWGASGAGSLGAALAGHPRGPPQPGPGPGTERQEQGAPALRARTAMALTAAAATGPAPARGGGSAPVAGQHVSPPRSPDRDAAFPVSWPPAASSSPGSLTYLETQATSPNYISAPTNIVAPLAWSWSGELGLVQHGVRAGGGRGAARGVRLADLGGSAADDLLAFLDSQVPPAPRGSSCAGADSSGAPVAGPWSGPWSGAALAPAAHQRVRQLRQSRA